jgi:hypothetical protein
MLTSNPDAWLRPFYAQRVIIPPFVSFLGRLSSINLSRPWPSSIRERPHRYASGPTVKNAVCYYASLMSFHRHHGKDGAVERQERRSRVAVCRPLRATRHRRTRFFCRSVPLRTETSRHSSARQCSRQTVSLLRHHDGVKRTGVNVGTRSLSWYRRSRCECRWLAGDKDNPRPSIVVRPKTDRRKR